MIFLTHKKMSYRAAKRLFETSNSNSYKKQLKSKSLPHSRFVKNPTANETVVTPCEQNQVSRKHTKNSENYIIECTVHNR